MRFTIAVLLFVAPFAAAEEPKSWKGELVIAKKPLEEITFGDRLKDGTKVTYKFSGMFPIKVMDDLDGKLRIDDGDHEGWALKEEFVLSNNALAFFNARVKADPKDIYAQSMRGNSLFDKGEYDKAIKDFTECIKLDPDESFYYNSRGNALAAKKLFDAAIKDFSEAIRLNPEDEHVFCNRGHAWVSKKEYDKAIKDYGAAIEINKKFALAFYSRGNAWLDKKGFDQAIKDFSEAIRLDPKDVNSFNGRGIAWKSKKDYGKAIKDYEEVIRLDPKSVYGLGNRAEANSKLKKYQDTVVDFEKAMKLDSMDWLQRDYAIFLATCPDAKYRDGTKALKLAKAAIEKAGKDADWEYSVTLAAALGETGDFEGAVKEQKAALADKSLDADDKKEQEARLKLYLAKKPFRDE
jgi:Flp pilus assembly protein TadD